ncbi:MAG: hypothetical protein ACI82G_002966, partial [Bradymonadia bacterium]
MPNRTLRQFARSLALFVAFVALAAGCARGVADEELDPALVDADTGLSVDVPELDAGADSADAIGDAMADTEEVEDAADVAPDIVADVAPDITPDIAPDVDADTGPEFPTIIVAVETRLSTPAVRAGDSVFVSCDPVDDEGAFVPLPPDTNVTYGITPLASLERGATVGEFVAVQVGDATIACRLPGLSLIDDTPEDLEIIPGVPFTVVTSVDEVIVSAGQTINATCEAFDIYGNRVPDAPLELLVTPFGEGVLVEGTTTTIERSGQYTLACSVDGASELVPALVEVRPALPASLTLSLSPDRDVYSIGEVATLRYRVEDRFGNLVRNAPVSFWSLPLVPAFGSGRYRFDREGEFELGLRVAPPTEGDVVLEASQVAVVNEVGPDIQCDAPFDGQMVDAAPGEVVVFEGFVADVAGVDSVTVNGVPATLDDGVFRADVVARFGVNVVTIEAFDTFGQGNRRVCAFLASDEWAPTEAFINNSISLTLAASAFDDGNRNDGLDSITDLLVTVLNSQGLVNQLDGALRAADPLYPERCVVDAWLFCAVNFGLNYNSVSIGGANDISITLTQSGFRVDTTIRNVNLGLRVRGTFSTNGNVQLSRLRLRMRFGLSLSGGRPRVVFEALETVEVGGINTSFSGVSGFILDLIVDIFEGTVRNIVRDELSDFVTENFAQILDELVSSLDIDSLGASFDVPRLDGSGTAQVGFAARFSEVRTGTNAITFGLGSRFSGDVARPDTLGVAIEAFVPLDTSNPNRTVRAAVQLALLNQVLH